MRVYKYEIGDHVRIVSKKTGKFWNSGGGMDKYLGNELVVSELGKGSQSIYYRLNDLKGVPVGWCWYPWMIEGKVDKEEDYMFDKSKLLSGDILEFEDGGIEMVMLNTVDGDLRLPYTSGGERGGWNDLHSLSFKTMQNCNGRKVIRVWRASGAWDVAHIPDFKDRYYIIWERKPEAKKMTVAQLEEAMGMAPGTLSVVKES